jgi:hypothetical protein
VCCPDKRGSCGLYLELNQQYGSFQRSGGSVTESRAVSATGTITAEAYALAELETHFEATDEDFIAGAYAGVRASATLTADGEVMPAAVPGTSAWAGNSVSATGFPEGAGCGA